MASGCNDWGGTLDDLITRYPYLVFVPFCRHIIVIHHPYIAFFFSENVFVLYIYNKNYIIILSLKYSLLCVEHPE